MISIIQSFPLIPFDTVICSFKLFNYCKQKYPKRNVQASVYCDYDDFYYWSKTGKCGLIRNKTEVWVLGREWPMIVRRR